MSEHPERPWQCQEKQILFLSNFRITSDICKISKLVLVVTLCHTSGALKFQKGNHIGNSLMIFYAFLGLFAKKTDCLDLLDKFDKSTGEGNKIPVRPVPFHGIHLLYVGPSRSGWAHQTAFSIDSIGTSRKVNFLDRNIRQTCLSMSEDV
jgi:hypothetical protein